MQQYENHNISYFIFKPEAEKKFEQMRNEVEKRFPKVQYYAVPDCVGTFRKLYKHHYNLTLKIIIIILI